MEEYNINERNNLNCACLNNISSEQDFEINHSYVMANLDNCVMELINFSSNQNNTFSENHLNNSYLPNGIHTRSNSRNKVKNR